jgi:hypothetical protein
MSNEIKSMGQWLAWVGIMLVLFVGTTLLSSPVIARYLLQDGLSKEWEPLGHWSMAVGAIVGLIALNWWLFRGQQYERRKRRDALRLHTHWTRDVAKKHDCPLCQAGMKPVERVQVLEYGPDGKPTGRYMLMDKKVLDGAK